MAPKTLELADCEKLLNELKNEQGTARQRQLGTRNHCIALLMLDAGLRVGEVVKLRIGDLFYNSQPVRSIIIRAEIAKNRRERQIPVSERLAEALKEVSIKCLPDITLISREYVFRGINPSETMTTRQVERIISSAAERAIGRPIHPHVLRHTFGTRLMKVCDIRTVQELLGHKCVSSTQVYTHPDEEDKRNAINAVEKNQGSKHD
jgi:site-specific recombinase XerD